MQAPALLAALLTAACSFGMSCRPDVPNVEKRTWVATTLLAATADPDPLAEPPALPDALALPLPLAAAAPEPLPLALPEAELPPLPLPDELAVADPLAAALPEPLADPLAELAAELEADDTGTGTTGEATSSENMAGSTCISYSSR